MKRHIYGKLSCADCDEAFEVTSVDGDRLTIACKCREAGHTFDTANFAVLPGARGPLSAIAREWPSQTSDPVDDIVAAQKDIYGA